MKFKRTVSLALAFILGFSIFGELPFTKSLSFSASAASTAQTKTTASTSLKKLRKKIGNKGKYVGLAFVGYVNGNNSKNRLIKYAKKSKLGKTYAFVSEIPAKSCVSTGGAELYALVPQNGKVSFALYKSKMTNGGKYKNAKKPFYTGKPGEVILLCCNPSELYSDVLVVAKVGKKNLYFRPTVSLKNGKLSKNKTYYDFSVYKTNTSGVDKDVNMCYEILFGYDEIRYYMNRGMSLVYTGKKKNINGRPCWIFAVGKTKNNKFVTYRLYGVSDNLVCVYDSTSRSWTALGMG